MIGDDETEKAGIRSAELDDIDEALFDDDGRLEPWEGRTCRPSRFLGIDD